VLGGLFGGDHPHNVYLPYSPPSIYDIDFEAQRMAATM